MFLSLSQCLMFLVLNITVRWHYRLWPLLMAMSSNLAGLIIVFFSEQMLGFGIGFFLIGACGGVSYSASLYYAISLSSRLAGSRSGWHEFYLGLGALLGPLMGGFFAQYISPRSPYAFSAGVVLIIIMMQVIYFRLRARSA